MTEEESDRLCEARIYAAVRREREEIVEEINKVLRGLPEESGYWRGLVDARSIIRARGEGKPCCGNHPDVHGSDCRCACHKEKPGKIALLRMESNMSTVDYVVFDKLNELIDDRNARRE